ncbi:MAG TPA: hypothetical protein DCS97_15305, partial [Planctomycetes bacterium]|nr:hypothetical protein [Planctomycetota bacterium]
MSTTITIPFCRFLANGIAAWLVAALCLLLPAVVGAADYYVSSSGNDANAGTSTSAPWKTVGKVNGTTFYSGDTVSFLGGDVFTDAALIPKSSGTAVTPIVFGSYGTGKATLQAPSGRHGIEVTSKTGVTVRDFIVIGPGLVASDATPKNGVSLSSVTDVRIERIDVSYFYRGISITSSSRRLIIDGCHAHHNVSEGIWSLGGGNPGLSHLDMQVLNCEVSYNLGDPTLTGDVHSGSGMLFGHLGNGLIDRCYAHHNGGGTNDTTPNGPCGIWLYYCTGTTIQRSLVHDQMSEP